MTDLFRNKPFLLLLRHLLANILLHTDKHVFVVLRQLHQANQTFRKCVNRLHFQKRLLFGKRNLQERDHPVKRVDVAIHRKQRFDHALGDVPVHRIVTEHVQHVFKLIALVFGLDKVFPRGDRHLQKSIAQNDRTQIHHGVPLKDNLHATIRERRHVHHARNHAHCIEIEHRIVKRLLLHIFLGDQDNFVIVVFGKFKSTQRHFAAHQNAPRRERKNNSIPQREQRIGFIKIKSHTIKLVNLAKLRGNVVV